MSTWILVYNQDVNFNSFNGDPNTWDNLVLSLAGVKQVEPYPTPGDASKRSFPITPLTEGQ